MFKFRVANILCIASGIAGARADRIGSCPKQLLEPDTCDLEVEEDEREKPATAFLQQCANDDGLLQALDVDDMCDADNGDETGFVQLTSLKVSREGSTGRADEPATDPLQRSPEVNSDDELTYDEYGFVIPK